MNQQVRSVRLTADEAPADDGLWAQGEVLIIGPGTYARAAAGQTVAEALRAARVTLPTFDQTVRVNLDEVDSLNHVLRAGDRITIANRVMGGA